MSVSCCLSWFWWKMCLIFDSLRNFCLKYSQPKTK